RAPTATPRPSAASRWANDSMNNPEIRRSMLRNSLVLGLFAIVTVGLVAFIQQSTAERIAQAERQARIDALAQILPAGSYDNALLDSQRELRHALLGPRSVPAWIATLEGQPSAVILQATAPDEIGRAARRGGVGPD